MNLRIDSRKVEKGDIFFCIKGTAQDGHDYASSAAEKGASVIVYSHDIPFSDTEETIYIKVDDTVKALNEAADSFYGFPSKKLKMFGVTGTNGKTTIAYMLADIYSKLSGPTGYIGTVGSQVSYNGEKKNVSHVDLTTPDPISMNSTLAEMRKEGAVAAAIEASAHGLAQGRVDSVDFDYAIYTNLTREHLDYFGDMENYFQGKALFFKMLKPESVAIINIDDEYGERMKDLCNGKVFTYGIEGVSKTPADYMATNVEYSFDGMDFDIKYSGSTCHVKTDMHVTYNLYNLLAIFATLHQAGLPEDKIAAEFLHIPTIPGRMTSISEGQDFKVIVDYAHTDDSYEQLLRYVKEDIPGVSRIITVNGAPGKRDKLNRESYAKWIGMYGDFAVLTEEDPRDEKPEDIAREIASFLPDGFPHEIISDRYEAIKYAIDNAQKNDVILILGKGAETYQDRASGKEFWMGDDTAAREILKAKFQ